MIEIEGVMEEHRLSAGNAACSCGKLYTTETYITCNECDDLL